MEMPIIAMFAQAVSDDDTLLCSNSFEWYLMCWEDFSRVIFGPNGRPGLFKGDFSSMSIYKVQRKGIVRILVRKQTKAFANYLGLFF